MRKALTVTPLSVFRWYGVCEWDARGGRGGRQSFPHMASNSGGFLYVGLGWRGGEGCLSKYAEGCAGGRVSRTGGPGGQRWGPARLRRWVHGCVCVPPVAWSMATPTPTGITSTQRHTLNAGGQADWCEWGDGLLFKPRRWGREVTGGAHPHRAQGGTLAEGGFRRDTKK